MSLKHWVSFLTALALAIAAAFGAAMAFMRFVVPSLGNVLAATPSISLRVAITFVFAATILTVGLIFTSLAYATARWLELQTRLAQRDIAHARAEMIAIWGPAVDEAFEKAQKAQ